MKIYCDSCPNSDEHRGYNKGTPTKFFFVEMPNKTYICEDCCRDIVGVVAEQDALRIATAPHP